jgi:acetyl esterase/lipase
MRRLRNVGLWFGGVSALASVLAALGGTPQAVEPLWPGPVPGEEGVTGVETNVTKASDREVAGRPVVRLGNIALPTVSIYTPPPEKATGTAVLVCPGGGYNILAWDLEGEEVCDWLNSLGVTAALLKYRVPKRPGLEKHEPPLQDAQRALSLLRHRAGEWGIAADRIGVLGFSAGGHLAATLSTRFSERSYPAVDAADAAGCRPDFTLLIYPAYLTVKEKSDAIAPELILNSNVPPTFMVMAQDDPVRVENVMYYGLALRRAGVPWELHVYDRGGHGYGLRRTDAPVTTWPDRAAEWMRSRGLLARAAAAGSAANLAQQRKWRFDFEGEPAGALPAGWSQQHFGDGRARWEVRETAEGKVLAQVESGNPNKHFNLAVVDMIQCTNVNLRVRWKAVSGAHDQGGGFVWRYQDEKNHYIVRANPLEDNVVAYKMVQGIRTDLPLRGKGRTYGVKVAPMGKDWHTLRVEARGSVFTVFLDDRQLFQAEDATISDAGKMGLWTKADAVTLFDDFEVETADVP